ncbi:hypothetical protein J437_LFUL004562 [Ladona fulva]|uniref:Uncharacterized protein n=1 Tax=Ladona fulva TaxID=123851 RepID=A0A8K0JTR8_LADFU|nr:hypothetical protein J437_LFUL004562 [Ladona fulva]
MSEVTAQGENVDNVDSPDLEEIDSNYKPPPEKTIEEILEADKEDESLRKYKETLLGEAKEGKVVVVYFESNLLNRFKVLPHVIARYLHVSEPDDPRKVIVKKLALCVVDRPDMELDLTGDLTQLKKQVFVIKEGVAYKIRIDFVVQREIVHGLKYVQKTFRMAMPGKCIYLEIEQ